MDNMGAVRVFMILGMLVAGIFTAPLAAPSNISSIISTPINDSQIITTTVKNSLDIDTSCNKADQALVQQAYSDALMLAAAVGNPDDMNFYGWLEKDWYGDPRKEGQPAPLFEHIKSDWKRFQAAKKHSVWGNWWYKRHIYFACHNDFDRDRVGSKISHCAARTNVLPAHTFYEDAGWWFFWYGKHRRYYIVLCDKWFDMFTTSRAIELIETGPPSSRNNVKSMYSQGTSMLHELHHLEYVPGIYQNEEGFTSPRVEDMSLDGDKELAYGAERAKYLAKSTRGGMLVAYRNAENRAYYAVSRWMKTKWGQDVTLPNPGRPGSANPLVADGILDPLGGLDISGFECDNCTAEGNTFDVGKGPLPEDWDFYGGNACSSKADCVGVCRPGVYTYCWDGDKTCRCGFKFDPSGGQ